MTLADKLREPRPEPSWKLRPEVLLHSQIPKPMHGMAPRVVLGQAWWDKTRRAAYASTEFHCVACGVHKTAARYRPVLEGHELYDIDYLEGRMTYLETVPLCVSCHSYIHHGRLKHLCDTRHISAQRYIDVIQHGDGILKKHGLVRLDDYPGPYADWSEWRMVVDGREYPSQFRNIRDWERYHRDA